MRIKKRNLSLKEKILRGHYAFFLKEYLYTVIMDMRIAGTSMGGLTCNKGDGIFPVQSASYRILRELIPCLDINANDVFVDIGCGKGRLLGYLNIKKMGAKKYYGVEINKKAAKFACKVFRNDPKVRIICKDATKATIRDGTVFFLYNPFGPEILDSFLTNLEKTARQGCRIYYLHAVYNDVFNKHERYWKCKKKVTLRPKHHIPVLLVEYVYIRKNREDISNEKPSKS